MDCFEEGSCALGFDVPFTTLSLILMVIRMFAVRNKGVSSTCFEVGCGSMMQMMLKVAIIALTDPCMGSLS